MPQCVLQALGLDIAATADALRLARRATLFRKKRLRVGLRAQRPLLPLGRVPQQVDPCYLPLHGVPPLSAPDTLPALTPHARCVFFAGSTRWYSSFPQPHGNYTRVRRASSSRT